jgi:hypothetical protein
MYFILLFVDDSMTEFGVDTVRRYHYLLIINRSPSLDIHEIEPQKGFTQPFAIDHCTFSLILHKIQAIRDPMDSI